MNGVEYKAILDRVGLIARMTRGMDLTGFLQHIEQSEAMTPFLDPTLYLKLIHDPRAMADLTAAKEIGRALLKVQEATDKIAAAWGLPPI